MYHKFLKKRPLRERSPILAALPGAHAPSRVLRHRAGIRINKIPYGLFTSSTLKRYRRAKLSADASHDIWDFERFEVIVFEDFLKSCGQILVVAQN